MTRRVKGLAATLAAATMLPSVAWAATYPRTISIEGMNCIEILNDARKAETWCRQGDDMTLMSVGPPTQEEVLLLPAMAVKPAGDDSSRGWAPTGRSDGTSRLELRSPAGLAMSSASRNDRAGRYFAGGFLLGALLGPIGWAIGGINANNSDVFLPATPPEWSASEQDQFVLTYGSEVRTNRVSNALIGGLAGSVTTALVIGLIVGVSK